MVRWVFLLGAPWTVGSPAGAQTWQLIREVRLPPPVRVSVDRYHRIFVGDAEGGIRQYDGDGQLLLTYSPPKVGAISLLEAWNTTKIFAFSRDLQQYTLLDRFLAPLTQNELDPDRIGFARNATLAADDQLWVLDDTDFSLKKYDPRTQTVTLNAPLNRVLDGREYDLTFLREYQNVLFLNDRHAGILVFDNLGNYRKTLPFAGLDYFGLLNEELYFLRENRIHFFHLYASTERTLDLPTQQPGRQARYALVFENRVVLFYGEAMAIYRMEK
ncbi:MAG: hypothetical protein H7Z75_17650 [Ferruginibacter sp.]|nr:hypothetical protein [Cytophagales bacterium]